MLRPFFLPLFMNVLESEFSELPLYGVLGSSTVLAAFATMGATAPVGSVGKGGQEHVSRGK